MASLDIKPLTIEFGWGEFDNKKDAQAYARGVIANRFMAHEESWIAVHSFHGGYFWEAHEGGSGKSHVKSAAHALEMEPGGQHWFINGDRAYMVVMQDGKPFPHLLPIDLSIEILNGGTEPLVPDCSMLPYIKKGTGWLVTGISMASMSAVFFIGSIVFYAIAYNPGPSVRATDISNLPHTQYSKHLNSIGIEEIVEKLELTNGDEWGVKTRTHKVEGLDILRKERQLLERAAEQKASREDAARQAKFIEEIDEIDNSPVVLQSPNILIDENGVTESINNDDQGIPVGTPAQPSRSTELN